MNHQEYGQSQEGETVTVRGIENEQDVYPDADGSTAFSGIGTGTGTQLLTLDRKDSQTGAGNFNPFGGVIDQLIDDAKKQLVKSQECIVWYREEVKEYQEKLNNLIKLKELQEQQQREVQQQQQSELSNSGGDSPK